MPRIHPPYAPEYRRRIIELARAGAASPSLRPRLSIPHQLRKESLSQRFYYKPYAIHRIGVTPED